MNEIATQWVEALRSGNYEQGQTRLRDKDNKRCCLGVLADVIGLEWSTRDSESEEDMIGDYGFSVVDPDTGAAYSDFLPEAVYASLNLSFAQTTYSEMNDGEQLTFDQIADFIEDAE